MSGSQWVYLALGDSMSIDDYTGVVGGGAVRQFHRWLGSDWVLDDRTCDGCMIENVPTNARGDLITLTIGGNDLLWNREEYLARGLSRFDQKHLRLLQAIRRFNPNALFVVGDIYRPNAVISSREEEGLAAANRAIHANCLQVGACIAHIHDTFRGHEHEYLCYQIEPTLKGAQAIAGLFRHAYQQWQSSRTD